ncbi:MAG: hypothetical protein KBT19_03875 [Lachnospiraceae bacterium]|nr:hypothetical protein [Candidatus Colinaster equi]
MKSELNTVQNRILAIILSFAGAIGVQGIMAFPSGENIRYANSMMSVFVFVAGSYMLCKLVPVFVKQGKRECIWAVVFSFCLSGALHYGARLEAVDSIRIADMDMWIHILALTLFLAPVIAYLWDTLPGFLMSVLSTKSENRDDKKFAFYRIWILIFVLWIPTFLALYPGAFVYDAREEYVEVISRAFTTHHPLVHVLALGGTIHAAEYVGLDANVGIAVYVVIQMLILSAILAYAVRKLYLYGMNHKYCFAMTLVFGLFPIFPMYAVCTAKDTLFTGFFLLVIICLIDFVKIRKINNGLFVAGSVCMMLLRNNGIYAYLVSIPLIVMLLWKKRDKRLMRLVVLMVLSIVLAFGGNTVLKLATGASDNEHQEMLTVPIQQLARVYTYSKETFSQDELNTLYEIIPQENLETYSLRVSDIVKSGFDNMAYEKNPAKYRKLWADIGMRKPIIYFTAWLGTSYGYWYPDALNNVYKGNQMYTFQYDKSSYFGFETEPPGHRDSKFGLLERFYEHLSLDLYQQRIPVVSMLFAPGFVFWVYALVLFGNMMRGRMWKEYDGYVMSVPLIPVGMLWLTVLLGPTTLVRYVLILWMIIPLLPILLMNESRNTDV